MLVWTVSPKGRSKLLGPSKLREGLGRFEPAKQQVGLGLRSGQIFGIGAGEILKDEE